MTYLVPVPSLVLAAQPEAEPLDPALWGFLGVIVGAVVTLIGSVAVPWIRDVQDRKRREAEVERAERREWLMSSIAALLGLRQALGAHKDVGAAVAAVGTAMNQLRVRLKPEEEDVNHVLLVMLAMIQEPRPGIESMVGQSMMVLVDWVRGDLSIVQLVPEVERRAGVKFAADRSSAEPVRRP